MSAVATGCRRGFLWLGLFVLAIFATALWQWDDPRDFSRVGSGDGSFRPLADSAYGCRSPEAADRMSQEKRSNPDIRAVLQAAAARGDCRLLPRGARVIVTGRNSRFVRVAMEDATQWIILAGYVP